GLHRVGAAADRAARADRAHARGRRVVRLAARADRRPRRGRGRPGPAPPALGWKTGDHAAVEAALAKCLPRFGGSGGRVEGPLNGWVVVYAELIDHDRLPRERLGAGPPHAPGAGVLASGGGGGW